MNSNEIKSIILIKHIYIYQIDTGTVNKYLFVWDEDCLKKK